MTALAQLHADCAALGTILFTVTAHDFDAMLFRRMYSSHPAEYPATGTKPMARDAWFDLCVTRGETFVANTPDAFAALFFDHALITSMGLGSAVNIPVTDAGLVVGTVNLLAEQGHFTADRMARYQDAVVLRGDGLLTALRERGATPG
jgi:hypothetical protein